MTLLQAVAIVLRFTGQGLITVGPSLPGLWKPWSAAFGYAFVAVADLLDR